MIDSIIHIAWNRFSVYAGPFMPAAAAETRAESCFRFVDNDKLSKKRQDMT